MKRSLLFLSLLLACAGHASTLTFVVDRNDDADVGTCTGAPNDCTLRGAINAATLTPESDTITFAIPGGGVRTIAVGPSGLPPIPPAVTIDGSTQPGFSATPLIELEGTGAGANSGLTILGGNSSIVRALAINRFTGIGISIRDTTGNTIQGCFIGTNAAGTVNLGNGIGVAISAGSSNNTIGGSGPGTRNLISGNGAGVEIANSPGNRVQGNFIGTDFTGTAALGNRLAGVIITGGTGGNTIGGTLSGAGNLISGNQLMGVSIEANASSNLVQGNFIGTDVTGTVALGNGTGVTIEAAGGNTIGGTAPGTRNVISGNVDGVTIVTFSLGGNLVQGNYIGTDVTGVAALGNSGDGVRIEDVPRNVIGGPGSGAGNVISGNDNGVVILDGDEVEGEPTENRIEGNFIGTDAAGTAALGNTTDGILIRASDNTVGSTLPAARNLISGNGTGLRIHGVIFTTIGRDNAVQGNFIGTDITGVAALGNSTGVAIVDAAENLVGGSIAGAGNTIAYNDVGVALFTELSAPGSNQIFGNSIFRNAGLGIDLFPEGVTPNDENDGDAGPNSLQNFPVIESAVSSGTTTTIRGTLNSVPNGTFFIDLYSSAEADPSGFGEGQNYLGAVRVTSDERSATFSFTAGRGLTGQFITATATDVGNGNTSEFSAAVSATMGPGVSPTPTPTPSATPTPSPTPSSAARPLNISTRLRVQTGDNALIGGFIIKGSVPKKIIVRALGQSLSDRGIANSLADPVIELYGPGGGLLAQNDNWRQTQQAEIQASGVAPENDFEAAIIATLPPEGYTVIVRGKNGTSGVALVEGYDLEPGANSELANISTRGFVETGDGVMIGGFILGGNTGGTQIALRGLGQSLANAGLSNVLADPTLDLRDANGTRLAFNDDWMDNPAQAVQLTANGLALPDVREAGIFTTLPPGAFTVILAGESDGSGIGLVEIYNLKN